MKPLSMEEYVADALMALGVRGVSFVAGDSCVAIQVENKTWLFGSSSPNWAGALLESHGSVIQTVTLAFPADHKSDGRDIAEAIFKILEGPKTPTTADDFLMRFPTSEPRENCLIDMGCPKCGNRDSLQIRMCTFMRMYDTGTDHHEETEWDLDSDCQCPKCRHEGTVRDFTFEGLDDLIEERKNENGGTN